MIVGRSYPQPDSPAPNIGARERALAVFKYLLDLEPEAAVRHPMFACIQNAFSQEEIHGWNLCLSVIDSLSERPVPVVMGSSLVPMISTMRSLAPPAAPVEDGGL